MKVIGITGGVGSGKSALLHAVEQEFSCRILLADDIANFLKEPGQPCFEPLCTLLGKEVLDEAGFIDKAKMAEIIFGDKTVLEKVNALVHPAVKKYLLDRIAEERKERNVDYVFVEAALFIEAGYRDMVDCLWYIFAKEEVRIERLKKNRGYTQDKIYNIMKKQLQEEAFRKAADAVIDNSGSLEKAMEQVRAELKKINEIM